MRSVLGGVSGLAFSPDQVSSTQAFYDPSDLSSLYQSRTGRNIVSADGQTIGIMLDKGQMGGKTAAAFIASQPELVTNGGFDTDLTGWSESDPNLTATWVAGGVQLFRSGAVNPANCFIQTVSGLTIGRFYRLNLNVSNAQGAWEIIHNTGTYQSGAWMLSGQNTLIVKALSITITFRFWCDEGPTVILDNISLKALPGYHAIAPSDAARPLYKTDGTHHYVDYDGVDDVLNATLPDLGSTASVWYMKQDGTAVYAANQSISGAYALPAVDMRGLIIVDGPISASDQTNLTTYYA